MKRCCLVYTTQTNGFLTLTRCKHNPAELFVMPADSHVVMSLYAAIERDLQVLTVCKFYANVVDVKISWLHDTSGTCNDYSTTSRDRRLHAWHRDLGLFCLLNVCLKRLEKGFTKATIVMANASIWLVKTSFQSHSKSYQFCTMHYCFYSNNLQREFPHFKPNPSCAVVTNFHLLFYNTYLPGYLHKLEFLFYWFGFLVHLCSEHLLSRSSTRYQFQ